jgi:hypothetical protein
MPITHNGTNITSVVFNGTTVTTVIFNGTTVFTSLTWQWVYYGNESLESGLDIYTEGPFGTIAAAIAYITSSYPPADYQGYQAEVYEEDGLYWLFESRLV